MMVHFTKKRFSYIFCLTLKISREDDPWVNLKLHIGVIECPRLFDQQSYYCNGQFLPHHYSFYYSALGSFRFDYEYEIEYEYDFRFSNQ